MSEILLSQLAHVELFSPKPEETVAWMKEIFGLEETTREGQSVYLRGWAEWLHSSLIVTEAKESGVGRIGWRTYGAEDPETIAKRLQDSEEHVGWVDDWTGHGRTYQYRSAFGRHLHEVFWDVDLYEAPEDKKDHARAQPSAEDPDRWRGGRAVPRPCHDAECEHGRRHRVLQEARRAPHRAQPRSSRASRCSQPSLATASARRMTSRSSPTSAHDRSRPPHRLPRRPARRRERVAEIAVSHGTPIELAPACTASMRSPTSTSGSRAASGWRSTPAAGSTHARLGAEDVAGGRRQPRPVDLPQRRRCPSPFYEPGRCPRRKPPRRSRQPSTPRALGDFFRGRPQGV